VVSHVAELRTRIPHQVVVSKSERGSTVQVRTTDEATPAA
jgi:exonuclease SbcC